MNVKDEKLEELLRTSDELTERLAKIQQEIVEHLGRKTSHLSQPAESPSDIISQII